ncbi:MAG TPA: Hpt domain-containing protein, partial [Edaphobacter sp.]|uniref:Hpt domain-containing protein n=1 Tax=Edaphobacter sp. TaxID=1934404 RepID=UPI002C9AC50A
VAFTAAPEPVAPSEPTEPSVATAELLERIDGDRAFLAELLDLFREDYPAQINAAREAARTGDAATLQRVGHALKRALGNLAAPVSARMAGQIEAMGRNGNVQSATAAVNELELELDRVITILDSLCMETTQ